MAARAAAAQDWCGAASPNSAASALGRRQRTPGLGAAPTRQRFTRLTDCERCSSLARITSTKLDSEALSKPADSRSTDGALTRCLGCAGLAGQRRQSAAMRRPAAAPPAPQQAPALAAPAAPAAPPALPAAEHQLLLEQLQAATRDCQEAASRAEAAAQRSEVSVCVHDGRLRG